MKANEMQVGGTHYSSEYQHWDLVIATGQGYFEGQATKYIARWRKKLGLQDLQKAGHFLDKLIEVRTVYQPHRWLAFHDQNSDKRKDVDAQVLKFSRVNELSKQEYLAIWMLAIWHNDTHLAAARAAVSDLIKEASAPPVPASDSNKHADRVERMECLVLARRASDFAGNTIEDCRYPNCDCKPTSSDPTGW